MKNSFASFCSTSPKTKHKVVMILGFYNTFSSIWEVVLITEISKYACSIGFWKFCVLHQTSKVTKCVWLHVHFVPGDSERSGSSTSLFFSSKESYIGQPLRRKMVKQRGSYPSICSDLQNNSNFQQKREMASDSFLSSWVSTKIRMHLFRGVRHLGMCAVSAHAVKCWYKLWYTS